jgi:DNA-binding PadR family transcriptional regulator
MGGEDIWDVKPAQVYTTLTRLEESGLVRQESVGQDGGPEKRIYALTPDGAKELANRLVLRLAGCGDPSAPGRQTGDCAGTALRMIWSVYVKSPRRRGLLTY